MRPFKNKIFKDKKINTLKESKQIEDYKFFFEKEQTFKKNNYPLLAKLKKKSYSRKKEKIEKENTEKKIEKIKIDKGQNKNIQELKNKLNQTLYYELYRRVRELVIEKMDRSENFYS